MKKKNPIISAIIAFSWLIIIIIGYFVTHKPINPSQAFIFASHIWKILLCLGVVCISGGLGKTFFRLEEFPSRVRSFLQVGLGIGLLSLSVLLIGSIWKINPQILGGLLVVFAIISYRFIGQWAKDLLQGDSELTTPNDLSIKTMGTVIGIIFLTQFFVSLAPATRYDALNYHLTLPKAYLVFEKIQDVPWLIMSGMPQVSEMIYTILLALGGESAVLIFNWIIGVLLSLGLFGFLQQKLDRHSAWVGVGSLFGGYTLASALSWGYVDLMAAFFGLGVIILLDHSLVSGKKHHYILAGVFSGLAFGCKYPAGVIFLAGLFTLIVYFLKNKDQVNLKNIALFIFGAGLFASPWLLKNIIMTGNPVYPFFFESGSMSQLRLNVYQGMSTYGDLLDLFLLPIRATIMGVDDTHGYSVSIGPLLLGLGMLAFLGWDQKSENHKKTIVVAGLLSLFGLFIWALGNQFSGYLIQTRFYFVLFPTFAILAGFGYAQLRGYKIGQIRIKRLVDILIILVLVFNAFQIISEMIEKNVFVYVLGNMSKKEYLEHNLGWYARAMHEIDFLGDESKILMLYEPRGYGCIPVCDPDEILDHWKLAYSEFNSEDEILSAWKSNGFTHILVYKKGMEFLREDQDPHHPEIELDALEKFTTRLPLVANYGDWYSLYQLNED